MSTLAEAVDAPQHAAVPQQPVKVADEQIGVNGAIAAALTRLVGSMPALYVALVIVGGWMTLATWGPLRQVDPFPFPFLLFLDNVVQLVLCLVILVGQRVLGRAADRRAVQTYDNAEAIFAQIADLHEHLDRHDRALSRGMSLLETSQHPWIERHRVQQPPQALDQVVTVNGRIAAWLTRRLGSMTAFYLAAGTQVVWIVLGATGGQTIDPYPFAFMSFLSTLAQLIFMMVIMVGQDVLGRAGDRRSEQTFLDAEAIRHECQRMKSRLTAQGHVIDRLSGYATIQVTEQLARSMHDVDTRGAGETRLHTAGQSDIPGGPSRPRTWEELSERDKESARAQARQLGEQLASIGCVLVPSAEPAAAFSFDDTEALQLARLRHEGWVAERTALGSESGPPPDGDRLTPWEQLSEQARTRHVDAVRRLPAALAGAGFQVFRDGNFSLAGAGEEDFTPEDWAVLQQSLMAAGVVVALAEGVVDAEEMFVLITKLRQASSGHASRLIRELAASSTFSTGLQPGTRYADYEVFAARTIRSATAIVARTTTQEELAQFRAFLAEIAEEVADANLEGGFLGIGAHRRVDTEAAAIEVVRRATDLEG